MAEALRTPRIGIIGAGMAGLVCALLLADRGFDVRVFERGARPGGKLREVAVGGARIDSGPTVLTLPEVLEEIFDMVGETLATHLVLRRAQVLARHSWTGGPGQEPARLDLFADEERSLDEIGCNFGARAASGFRAFRSDTQRMFALLDRSFMRANRPSVAGLVAAQGLLGAHNLLAIRPFTGMWSALGGYFPDPRLRQLFGRYATYCGSSPFSAPATLMLVADAERRGVHLVEGGMHRIALVLENLARARGASFSYGCDVAEITTSNGRADGLRLAGGEHFACDAIVFNGDAAALSGGLFGQRIAHAVRTVAPSQRSLSAVTFSVLARANGFPLASHNVFFSNDYAGEFADIASGRSPRDPTIYVCAQDRGFGPVSGPERLFCIVNAPANGDSHPLTPREIRACETTLLDILRRHGLTLEEPATVVTTPTDFHAMFPGTGGALYGMASHGWRASFTRPTARTRMPGLYLAGGSAHPGPGVPMAALSGMIASRILTSDFASTGRSRSTATPGGISTRSATTGDSA